MTSLMCRKPHVSPQTEAKSHSTKTVAAFSCWHSWSYNHTCNSRKHSQILTPKSQYLLSLLKKIRCLWNCHSPGLRSVKQCVVNTGGVSGCCSCSKSFTLAQESEEAQKLCCLKQTQKYCRVKSWRRRGKRCFFLLWWHLCNARYICAHTERIVANLFPSWALGRTPHSMKPLKLVPEFPA